MTQSEQRRTYGILGLSVLGAGISFYQTSHFFDVRSGQAGFEQFCNVGSFNCEAIDASRYAELIWGIPLSGAAAAWYLAIAAIALLAVSGSWKKEALQALLGMTGIATLFSVVYLYFMISKIGYLCMLCLTVDAINLLSLGLVLSMKPDLKGETDKAHWKTIIWSSVACFAVALVVVVNLNPASGENNKYEAEMIESVLSKAPAVVPVRPENPQEGSPDALITIVKFSDFQCPSCKSGALTLHPLRYRYGSKLRIVYKQYPLDNACNPEIKNPMHPVACQAARIALCASKQDKFKAVYEKFFDQQPALVGNGTTTLAQQAGADLSSIETCLKEPWADQVIIRDVEEAKALGVESTPTFFVNGRQVRGAIPTSTWIKIIDRLLAGK